MLRRVIRKSTRSAEGELRLIFIHSKSGYPKFHIFNRNFRKVQFTISLSQCYKSSVSLPFYNAQITLKVTNISLVAFEIPSIFTNEKEFNTSVHEFSLEIVQDSTYTNDFKEVFGNGKIRNADVIKALSELEL